jgi:DNA-directed RNA polymerase specialized sigma24 family protein
MTATVETRPSADASRIQQVCSPCRHFLEGSLECRLLYGGGDGVLAAFEGKPCRPRDFLIRFFETRLRRTREPNPADRAEDLSHTLIHKLVESENKPSLLSLDLIGMRRFLAARAEHLLIDERRKTEGRVRCGNCRYHHHEGAQRSCNHPDPEFFWSGRTVVASEDPRRFDPPCDKYASGKRSAASLEEAHEKVGFEAEAKPTNPLATVELDESLLVAADCFAAVQQADPVAWDVIRMFFLEKQSLTDIADHLGVSSKTVQRKKSAGLDLLREQFRQRGVENLEGLL